MSKKKIAAVVLTTVALSVGSFSAADASSKTTKTVKRTTVTKTVSSVAGNKAGGPIDTVLAALVTKGTITQAQSDAIKAALDAARPAAGMGKPGKGGGLVAPAAREALVASTLGIDAATIKSRLAAGETLSAIAGVKKDALIAALVAQETTAIDAAVAAGKLTAAQATKIKSTLTAHVTAEVNSNHPKGPKGPMGGPGSNGIPSGTTNGIPQTN
jgi:hypothetical protein